MKMKIIKFTFFISKMPKRQRITNEQKKQYLDFILSSEVEQLNIPKNHQQMYFRGIMRLNK
jgi:hypothetical protein